MPPKKPRKTNLKNSTLTIDENLETIIQSPIRISSRTNKSTSYKFNSDEYLVYYPSKRNSPLKTPDSTQKRRKRLIESSSGKSQISPTSISKGIKTGQDYTAATLTSPSRSWSATNKGNLKWESKSLKTTKRSDVGPYQPESILPITITGDGKFNRASSPSSQYLSQEDPLLKEESEPYYSSERDWVLLKNRRESEDTPQNPSIFSTQIELELGTAPLTFKTRKEPDRSTRDANQPLYVLCRNWVRTKLNRPSAGDNPLKPEDLTNLDKDGNSEALTKLPPPTPSSTPNNARIPQPLTMEERKYISGQTGENLESESRDPENTTLVLDETVQKMGNIKLLDGHIAVWKKVRSKWVKAAALDDLRYEDSFAMLTKLYERNAGCVSG